MQAARDFCRGLRIIRQPRWECLATFITSSMKQVVHIRQISRALRETFRNAGKIDNYAVHTFPSPSESPAVPNKNCANARLLSREKLAGDGGIVSSGEANLEAWAALSDVDLRAKLCALPGVGAKVANCVMLFAYERLRAFPIDVWIERGVEGKIFSAGAKIN